MKESKKMEEERGKKSRKWKSKKKILFL